MILADINIDGAPRKVILHAPKNGFFFVIDRTDGQFISAKNFVDVNWATGYDAKGRPIETPIARVTDRPREVIPSPAGAVNWQPMSFNPGTGLAYLPAQNAPLTLLDDKQYGSIAVGWGGVLGTSGRFTDRKTPGTVYTFAVGGKAAMPAFVDYHLRALISGVKYNPADVQAGTLLYVSNCVLCHGVP